MNEQVLPAQLKEPKDSTIPKGIQLSLAQPEKQGVGDEVNQATANMENTVEDLQPSQISPDKSRGGVSVSWIDNPRKYLEGRHKVRPGGKGRRKVNPQANQRGQGCIYIGGPKREPIKGSAPSNASLFRENEEHTSFEANGFGPSQPPHTGFLENTGARLSEGIQHDFQYLEGPET
jgi:hypothetical protein